MNKLPSAAKRIRVLRSELQSIAAELSDLQTRVKEGLNILEGINSCLRGHDEDLESFGAQILQVRGNQRHANLSAQEARILSLITKGLTNDQIGEVLELKEKTVRNYVSVIIGRLGVNNRTEAAVIVASQLISENRTGESR